MSQTSELLRMKELIKTLDAASRAYYQEDREIMSNLEYDALYDELLALEQTTGVRLTGSPTVKVGYEVVSGLAKVTHDTPMLSLDKTKDIDKLVSFLAGHAGVLSWKLDGLTIVLKYDNGQLVQAVTRGNGYVGEDVTHTARVFANLPLTIPYKQPLIIRGEAVIGYTEFERINANLPETDVPYKNPRNLCSGTVRQLNSAVAAERGVRFYAFTTDNTEAGGNLRSSQLAWLKSTLRFSVVEHETVMEENVATAVADYKQRIAGQDIASDGLVLTYDDIAYGESLGATSKFPRDAIAFKWADEICETTFKHIEWNTSRTGLINPIAVFEPVDLEGTSVNRASLHNVSIMRGFALGAGDRITVYKANMIIPQVADNLTRSGKETIPEVCPVCGFTTKIVALREGEALYCQNPSCKAQLISALAHFTGRDALNIEGLSEQTLEKFTERGIITDYADLFTLAKHEQEIISIEGFGQKSYTNLITAVKKAADNVALPNFIYALGIRQVGLSNAKLLCAYYGFDAAAIERIITTARSDEYLDELLEIKGFGEIIAHSLHVYFSDDTNLTLLRRALPYLHFKQPPEEQEKALTGLAFVITGEVSRFENRKVLTAFIERHGGRTTGSVTSKTSYLINNDAASHSAKNKKAAELGVPILTEDTFLTNFGFTI